MESERRLYLFLTRFLHANRYPYSGQARVHASLENALGRERQSELLQNVASLSKIFMSAARSASPSSALSRASCLVATSRLARARIERPLSVNITMCERRSWGERTRAHSLRLSNASSIDTKFGRRMPSVLAISVWFRPGF